MRCGRKSVRKSEKPGRARQHDPYSFHAFCMDPELVLRGLLICPECGKILTGSASKGRSQYYHYYHCRLGCKFRRKSAEVNDDVKREIRKYTKPLPFLSLYKEAIVAVYQNRTNAQRDDYRGLRKQLNEAEERLTKARGLLVDGHLEPDDFRALKTETEAKISRLEAKLTESNANRTNIEPLLDAAIANISQLDVLYEEGTVERQRKIVGSIFPEKLVFDEKGVRTVRVNEALRFMLLFYKKLNGKKNGTSQVISDLSQDVIPLGLYFRKG